MQVLLALVLLAAPPQAPPVEPRQAPPCETEPTPKKACPCGNVIPCSCNAQGSCGCTSLGPPLPASAIHRAPVIMHPPAPVRLLTPAIMQPPVQLMQQSAVCRT